MSKGSGQGGEWAAELQQPPVTYLPGIVLQRWSIDHADLEACDHHRKADLLLQMHLQLLLADGLSLGLAPVVHQHRAAREPLLEFVHPVRNRGQGRGDEERARGIRMAQLGDQRDDLNSFT